MSLVRTALRLAIIEALAPHAADDDTQRPTLAGRFVYDSRLSPLDDLAAALGPEAPLQPAIVVYTDQDDLESGARSGGPPYAHHVEVALELSILAAFAEEGDLVVGCPLTDGDMEWMLDLIEAQVRFALFYGPSGRLFRDLTSSRVAALRSVPDRAAEEAVRLAIRHLTFKAQVADDCLPPAPSAPASGLDRLPAPARAVFAALADNPRVAEITAALAPSAPQMPLRAPLETVRLTLDVTADPASPGPAEDIVADVAIPQDPAPAQE